MSKFCVKKPFTVLVAVIIVLTLSAVSLTKMTTDLLPEIDLPYMMVVTTDPGASPEKVENDVTKPWSLPWVPSPASPRSPAPA